MQRPAIAAAAGLLVLFAPIRAGADDKPKALPDAAAVQTRLPQLLKELDSPRFDVRQRAAGEIESWLGRADLMRVLADEFSRRLLDPQLSYEVRWRLERWSRRLPPAGSHPAGEPGDEELQRLVRQLEDDNFAVRVGAARRIQWLADNPRIVGRVLARLKDYLASPGLSDEARQRLGPLHRAVRGEWLTSDPSRWNLPPVSSEQIRAWVDQLAQPADGPAARAQGSAAQQELLDLLVRDDYVPRVVAAVRQRMAPGLDHEATARLETLLEWTRPAMVAEYWQDRHHQGEQHLIVGEPSQAEGAVRPSHFDRIDDSVAHCVSGNTLSPGDYPSGIAFLHPIRDDAFFHLVNLPSPRRRMAYVYLVKRDEANRLAEITRRTLARWKEESRPIGTQELKLLAQLDRREGSQFVARYLSTPPADRPKGPLKELPRAGPSADRDTGPVEPQLLAELLAEQGTVEAVPDLFKAIQMAVAEHQPEPVGRTLWRAGLAIAARDPWPKVDSWLAGLTGRKDSLDDEGGAQLGATAAGLLLVRHGQALAGYPLRSTGPLVPAEAPGRSPVLIGYRYSAPEGPEQVRRWWDGRSGKSGLGRTK